MKETEIIEKLITSTPKLTEGSLGIGDDCAYLKELGLLITTDSMVSGVHFLEANCDYHNLGRKIISVSLSDIASMGGRSEYALLNFNIPTAFKEENINKIISGIEAVAAENELKIIGGDTVKSSELSITSTIIGRAPDEPAFRKGATAESDIWVSGELGLANLGLEYELGKLSFDLDRETIARAKERFNNPSARVELGPRLVSEKFCESMIDISDGLLIDLEHLLISDGLGAQVIVKNVPRPRPLADTIKAALGGGEDFELLFTAKKEHRGSLEKMGMHRIGETTSASGLLLEIEGRSYTLEEASQKLDLKINKGFEHNF